MSDIGKRSKRRTVVVQGAQQGSGVLLTDRLILTCAHLLGAGPPTAAHQESDEGPVPCTVVCRADTAATGSAPADTASPGAAPSGAAPAGTPSRPDAAPPHAAPPALDIALLLAERPLLPAERLHPPAFGGFEGDSVPRCRALGYPQVRRDVRQRLRIDGLRGVALTDTAMPGQARMDLELDRPAAAATPDGESLLRGLSGGPVLLGDILVGTVVEVPRDRLNHRLSFVPFTHVIADPRLLAALQEHLGPAALPRPRTVSGLSYADQEYEEHYRSLVLRRFRTRGVIGLETDGDGRRAGEQVDLDPSYIVLRAQDGPEQAGRAEPGAEAAEALRPAHRQPESVHACLARHPRILLEGKAGSGKTTLVTWLARRCAAGDGETGGAGGAGDTGETGGGEPHGLDVLRDHVPFVIKLRDVHAQGQKLPKLVSLHEGLGQLSLDPPLNWIDRVLSDRRALLLVDGLDEIPAPAREATLRELDDWLSSYPQMRCVLTARPGAVKPSWPDESGFTRVELVPMGDDEITAFVRNWYASADRVHTLRRPWQESAADLVRQITANDELADLAATPLLCAALCALHLTQHGAGELPTRLWDLLDRTLAMLLGRRDEQREIRAPEGVRLDDAGHRGYLQPIAAWMVRGGQQMIGERQVLRQIELAGGARGDGRDEGGSERGRRVLAQLARRTVLRADEGQDESYEFVHRTFQDFLASAEIARAENVYELLAHAEDERWREVIKLSVGHWRERPDVQRHLIQELLDMGHARRGADDESAREQADTLHILAAACFFNCDGLDGELEAAVHQALARLLPPAETDSHPDLPSLGRHLLGLLPDPATLTEEAAGSMAHLVVHIGGEAAMDPALRLARLGLPSVGWRLAMFWENFPVLRYAEEVLAATDLREAILWIDTLEQLDAAARLGAVDLEKVHIDSDLPAEHVLNTVTLTFRELRVNGENLTRLDPIAARGTALEALELEIPQVTDLSPLGRCSGLKRLLLYGEGPQIDVSFLRELPLLTTLTLERAHAGASAVHHLPRPSRVRTLALAMPVIGDLDSAPAPLPLVEALILTDVADAADLGVLTRVFPNVGDLRLELRAGSTTALDLTPLQALPATAIAVALGDAPGVRVTGAEGLGDRLDLSGT